MLREAQPPPKAAGAEGAPEPREGRKRKLEATKRGATRLLQPSAGRLNGFSGDTHGDKESINPSRHAQPSFGTFLILMFFLASR